MGEQARQQVVQCQAGVRSAATSTWPRTWCARTTRSTASTATCFRLALEIGDDADRREWAMHMMLVARCIERIGDNAVDIGEQTAFVVTGLFREFEDASHPGARSAVHRLICACIDIGSNTTRLLVADAGSGQLRELVTQRAFTRIGKSLPPTRLDPVGEDRRDRRGGRAPRPTWRARWAPSRSWRWPPPRSATRPTARSCWSAVRGRRAGWRSSVLSGEEEARLSFVGATRTLLQPPAGTIAVIDVGGGSSEIAVGEPDGADGVVGVVSDRLGLPGRLLPARRPALGGRAGEGAHATWPARSRGSSRRRRDERGGGRRHRHLAAPAGGRRARRTRRSSAASACSRTTPIAEVAARFELDPERVRLLPAGILVLEAISDLLALPLRIARGGLREGVLLELVEGRRLA